MDNQGKIDIRGIDPELHHQAKIAALQHRITIGEYYNLAIKEKLARDARKERK